MKSYLGQNFLVDMEVRDAIVQEIRDIYISSGATQLWEIGPGKGALTTSLISICPSLVCIEKDPLMQPHLEAIQVNHPQTQVIYNDILQEESIYTNADLTKTIVCGNLPYYITSPILKKFFAGHSVCGGGVFLIQHEVAIKLASNASKRSYLRRLINYRYDIQICHVVPPTAFDPAPKVTSAVIRITPKALADQPTCDYDKLLDFVELFNAFSRKTLRGSMSVLLKQYKKTPETLAFFTIPDRLSAYRLEDLSRDDMEELVG